MRTFLVTYDLRGAAKDYDGLYEAIKSCGSWWHHLESVWIITTRLSADGVFERIGPHLTANARCLVVQIHPEDRRQGWLPALAWDWLNENVR